MIDEKIKDIIATDINEDFNLSFNDRYYLKRFKYEENIVNLLSRNGITIIE